MKRKINLSHKLKEYTLEINYGEHEREMAEPSNNIARCFHVVGKRNSHVAIDTKLMLLYD